MTSQFVRKSSHLVIAVLLLAFSVALIANFNVQTAKAGGGGGVVPLYTMISTEMGLSATFTIYTTTTINGLNSYTVKSSPSAVNWYVSWLGTDFVCIKNGASVSKIPLCLPYSSIAGIKYQ